MGKAKNDAAIKELQEKAGRVAAKVFQLILSSDLQWDEAVFALGLTSKMLVQEAHKHGDGTKENCIALAHKRYSQGLVQEVVMATSKRH